MLIKIANLSKTYKGAPKKALSNINLEISSKKITGIVGPNGAGKTTLLKCILGILEYEEGNISFYPDEIKDNIGYYPEVFTLPEFMRGIDYLKLISIMKGKELEETKYLIDKLNPHLTLPPLDSFIWQYSKGQKEKLLFLSTIIGDPQILIFDEPFTGIDIISVEFLKDYIKSLKSLDKIIILSSHIPEIIAGICDEIFVLHNGILHTQLSFSHTCSLEEKIEVLITTIKSLNIPMEHEYERVKADS